MQFLFSPLTIILNVKPTFSVRGVPYWRWEVWRHSERLHERRFQIYRTSAGAPIGLLLLLRAPVEILIVGVLPATW